MSFSYSTCVALFLVSSGTRSPAEEHSQPGQKTLCQDVLLSFVDSIWPSPLLRAVPRRIGERLNEHAVQSFCQLLKDL